MNSLELIDRELIRLHDELTRTSPDDWEAYEALLSEIGKINDYLITITNGGK